MKSGFLKQEWNTMIKIENDNCDEVIKWKKYFQIFGLFGMDFNYFASAVMSTNSPESVETNENATKLEHLPVELHAKILSNVELTDVLSYGCTCRLFYQISENQQLW